MPVLGDQARKALEVLIDNLNAQPRHGGLTLPQVNRIKARVNAKLATEWHRARKH